MLRPYVTYSALWTLALVRALKTTIVVLYLDEPRQGTLNSVSTMNKA